MNGRGGTCALDTDVVIGMLDRADVHHDEAKALVSGLLDERVALRMSPVNYAEALVRPAQDEELLARAVGALDGLGIEVVAPTAWVARDAARIRAAGISLADAFAIAAARQISGSVASFDRGVRRAAEREGVPVLPPR